MKKRKLWKRIALAVLALGLAACLWEFFSSQNPYILPLRRQLSYGLLGQEAWEFEAEIAGLQPDYTFRRYENGRLQMGGEYDLDSDLKHIFWDGNVTRLVNRTDGYQLDLPGEADFDFSLSPLLISGAGEDYSLSISRETATYERLADVVSFELSTFLPFLFEDDSVQRHVMYYQYRFLLNEDWKAANRVQTESWSEGDRFFLISRLQDAGEAEYDTWLHAVVYTESREYIRLVFRYHSGDAAREQQLMEAVRSLQVFDPWGEAVYTTEYAPQLPEEWSADTAALYADIQNGDSLRWGIFTEDIYGSGVREIVPRLEEQLDYSFDVMLAYVHFGDAFPTEFMEQNRQAGRLVELTYQCTVNNNGYIFGYSPMLDLYRGALDDTIRSFAREAAQWGEPFLFRLNNEMNSDWTNYSGVANVADPQVFIGAWQRIYTIFQEEGVDNCIWIFNPHDRSAPPSKWNDALAYYPGNEYVQLLGVTGYNNGTYYSHQAETWRSFAEIYDRVEELYQPHFSTFPWIITEFASSGIGGDKAQWIRDMFQQIGEYENIKIAVWFSHADYDGETPARTYWLDETQESLQAFKEGLQGS